MTFHVGQKVVCIKDFDKRGRKFVARRGGIYTISQIVGCGESCCGLFFCEITNRHGLHWCSDNFRPVVERKTDISIFTQMLKPSKVRA